jgi:hypothetical protein
MHRRDPQGFGRGLIETVPDTGRGRAVHEHLVRQLCAQSGRAGSALDVQMDPLDGSVRIRSATGGAVKDIAATLTRHGLNTAHATATATPTLYVHGWDAAALRRRLGIALASVDDLSEEWAATADIAIHYFNTRLDPHDLDGPCVVDVDDWQVIAAVEDGLRRSQPLPHRAPAITDVDVLLELVDAAENRYSELIAEHVELAEQTVARYRAALVEGTPPDLARDAIVEAITRSTT